jgi:hypothetical protein
VVRPQRVRLVQDDLVAGEAAARSGGAGHEPQPLTGAELDRLLAVGGPRPLAPLDQRRGVLDQRLDPQERLAGRLELVRRVHDEPLAE